MDKNLLFTRTLNNYIYTFFIHSDLSCIIVHICPILLNQMYFSYIEHIQYKCISLQTCALYWCINMYSFLSFFLISTYIIIVCVKSSSGQGKMSQENGQSGPRVYQRSTSCLCFPFQGIGQILGRNPDEDLRVFLLAIYSHLYSFALRFLLLQTPAISYRLYNSVHFSYCTL